MYNPNDVNCGPGPEYGKLTVTQGDNTATPKTPEIINSIMAITNPLDMYVRRGSAPREDKILSPSEYTSADTCSSTSSNVDSPTSSPSVQSMCSQLIKEGLKLTLQKKRQNNLSTSENDSNASTLLNPICPSKFVHPHDESSLDTEDEGSMYGDLNGSCGGLTPEDEERRRRRRERNKVAATKCRQKKREKTENLVHESEILENQNQDLKTQIQDLEVERRRLMEMLTDHKPTCIKPSPEPSPVFDYQQPPSFLNTTPTVAAAQFIRDNKLNDQRQSSICSENAFLPDLRHLDAFDFQDAYVKNPSVMLNAIDHHYNDRSALKNRYNAPFRCDKNLPRHNALLNNANNYKNNISALLPNYNFMDTDHTEPHYDNMLYNAGNDCIV